MNVAVLLNAMPGAVSQGLIWGVMAIGVYVTYKILEFADLTVDGSMATGGAVCITLMMLMAGLPEDARGQPYCPEGQGKARRAPAVQENF